MYQLFGRLRWEDRLSPGDRGCNELGFWTFIARKAEFEFRIHYNIFIGKVKIVISSFPTSLEIKKKNQHLYLLCTIWFYSED